MYCLRCRTFCLLCYICYGSFDVLFNRNEPYVKICRYDNRWLWQSVACGEKRKNNIIPQPGNEPGTSWLSFRCSTNWATKESMLSHLHKTGHSPVTMCVCTVCPYRLVTYDLWFEGLPPCIKVHLDCLAEYVKICRYDNRWLTCCLIGQKCYWPFSNSITQLQLADWCIRGKICVKF